MYTEDLDPDELSLLHLKDKRGANHKPAHLLSIL